MKLFRPYLLREYGKYFKSDEVLINKVLDNCTLSSTGVLDILNDGSIGILGAFEWDNTPEGSVYWSKIYYHQAPTIRE